jgi:hypothetical protein
LAVGNYASRVGKPAIYTEWNWRQMTRLTPEARARVYPAIMDNLLATRSISELYPFQFQQTMCVNPHTRKGIRQYEPLWLSRRPKAEAFELMKLIERYSSHTLVASHEVLDTAAGTIRFHIHNSSGRALRLKASVEGPPQLDAKATSAEVNLAAGGSAEVPVTVALRGKAQPGFYHVFLRLEGDGGSVTYAWAEVRNPGQPEGATFNLNRPIAVVYGKDCPIIELEAAHMLAATIESASGRPVGLYSAQDLPTDNQATLVLVGKSPLATPRAGSLQLPDFDASVKFTLSYWMHAKDSAARRIGLAKKKIPAGADVANLP